MRLSRRRPAIVLAILLGISLVGLAITLNVGWIVLNWREILPLAVGIPVTLLLIAGVVLNTIFLVREMHRNERQDSFLNAVTHELKTPIASIRLYLETLQRRSITEEKRQEFYRIMLADSDRLLSTVEQVLKAGEIAQRDRSKVFEAVDLRMIVQEAVTRVRERNHLAGEAITLETAGEPVPVNGDPGELQTAVGNLLGNAVKYSPEGVSAQARVYVEGGELACFEVRDSGIGIDAVHLKRIFRRFYRVPTRAVLRNSGTGLGLFLVRSIAKQHGGSIEAMSKGEGQGSTFVLKLPLLAEAAPAKPAKPKKEAKA